MKEASMSHDLELDPGLQSRKPRAATKPERGPSLLSALGNKTAGRLLRSLRGTATPATVDESVARAIHAKRGTGRALDPAAQRDLGDSMGEDFADVQVHTDSEADGLNRAVQAEAFTTGKDIFFRHGKYDPASNSGRKLLAHELTHVVQQRDAPPKQDLTLSDPGDSSERQASAVADNVASSAPAPSVGVARQAAPAEEEQAQQPAKAQAEAPEEEQAATSRVERQAAPEEEEEGGQSG
jgi:Domain of unknown function (DUF4157)